MFRRGSFGVAQSPKSSNGGTKRILSWAVANARPLFEKNQRETLSLQDPRLTGVAPRESAVTVRRVGGRREKRVRQAGSACRDDLLEQITHIL
jgi:hypothetical protein